MGRNALTGKNLAMVFDKPSLRTRFSFSVAMAELGGTSIESVSESRKHEEPEDMARVLGGYSHAIMVRTHKDSIIDRMADASKVPVINGLSELHHPCQILADLMTLKERFGELRGVTLAYVGDGNNILHSLLLLSPKLGVNVRYCCPKGYEPDAKIVKEAQSLANEYACKIEQTDCLEAAVKDAHAVYTDVWTSMGDESEGAERERAFAEFKVTERLMKHARKGAVVMHCLPMVRGKEISETLPDRACSVIFQQSENRLHVQKALLIGLLSGTNQL